MQALTATQRAVVLRDMLAFTAADVAAMLDTSVAAVKSSLHRARARGRGRAQPRRRGRAHRP